MLVVVVGRRSGRRRCRRSRRRSTACTAPCPGAILPRSLVSVALTYAAAPGPDHRLAEVADVEDADGLADRGVLLDHARGVLQRHRPAAELGELRAERDVPVVQRRRRAREASAMRANLPQRAGARAAPAGYPAPVTTYTLRSASPAKTRADAVVVGVVPADARAPRLAPGGEDVAKAYGRKLAPAARHARRHRQGRRGRQGADRRHDHARRCWCSSGSATRRRRRRPPYAAPPASRPAPSPTPPRSRSRCPADDARAGARGDRGLRARRLHVHDVQEAEPTTDGARRRSSCSARRARARTAIDGVRGRPQVRRRAPSPRTRDWVNTPARRPHARRRSPTPSSTAAQGARKGRGAQGQGHGPRREAARRARLRRHPRRRPGLGRPAAAGRADLRARKGATTHLALVGKGITFDSGGLSHQAGARHERR